MKIFFIITNYIKYNYNFLLFQHTKQRYGCIVMLTFADDGLSTAEYVTKIFRSKQPRIGVLILQEQEKGVYSRAEEFIDDCFKQVIYFNFFFQRNL